MSLNIEGSSCARCKAYLFKDDDIVYCPVCGAPHHRECYAALGRCALEELHGTEQEYSKEKELEARQKLSQDTQQSKNTNTDYETVICRMCGENYVRADKRCPRCNTPNLSNLNGFAGFDFLGGIPKDYKIDENVTAEDAKRFVAANTHRYIPKFASLNKAQKISWNWFAFLFPSGWMLSRKMFKNGIITGVLTILATLLTYPLNLSLYNLGLTSATTSTELVLDFFEAIPSIGVLSIIFAGIGLIADLIIRIFSAMFGDYLYKSYAVSQILKIKKDSDDVDYSYRKKGGINIVYFFLATLVIQYLPSILIQLM